jgi:transcriptional/translational regulatory protein YebC/TACO1
LASQATQAVNSNRHRTSAQVRVWCCTRRGYCAMSKMVLQIFQRDVVVSVAH